MPISGRQTFPCPMVIRPMGEFRSPIDGTVIHDERQRRAHMRRHDVEEAPPEVSPEERRERALARREGQDKARAEEVAHAVNSAIEATGYRASD